ncbi:MAG: aldehyde dehydrogenase family protein [Deltaproteobacteria bacterium]|nr:aldehyde dehydrogenase family protein [Deltaproteobacteria bacterium]
MQTYKMYIGGEFVEAKRGKRMDLLNPATGEIAYQVPEAGVEDVDAAIQSARRAFDEGPWRDSTGQQRGRVLFQIAEALRRESKRLALLETENMGKPLTESEFDLADAATCFEYFGGWATKIMGEVNPVPDNALCFTVKEPVGVCGLIIPWNYPLLMAAWKLAPALAAGCTMILKPAEATPITVLELAKLLDQIPDLPKGVVNVVTGYGEVAGARLAQSPSVDKVAFTGSTEVGRSILRAAADTNLKKVTLELGGKSPNIFFADADFQSAVDGALFGVFINQGEVCSAGSRILVQRSIHKEFVQAMKKKAEQIVLGAGTETGVKMGPLITAEHRDRVESYIQKGIKEGAKLVTGGKRPNGKLRQGYFIQPTIFDDVTGAMTIAREEIFGPVAAVIPFDKEEEAVEIANKSDYGLAAAVWTKDIFKAFRLVKKIRAGVVWVNHMQPCYVEAPWGGYKMSGIGRELGKYGVENFLESKQVYVNLNEAPIGWY